jgi:ketosteroid isomerase-like protein
VLDDEAQAIWRTIEGIYAAYLAGDTDGIDRHIDEAATIWDTEQPELVHGLAGLAALRATRTSGTVSEVGGIETGTPVIDVWDDTAVVRYCFTVTFADRTRTPQRVRNTGVWRRRDGAWRIVHNHEDLLA